MCSNPDEAKLAMNPSIDDALASLTDALSTLRHSITSSQQTGSNELQTTQVLAADTADELRAIKSLISEARELVKHTTNSSSQ